LIVEDTPIQFDNRSTHSIYDPIADVRIPLQLKGVISFFETYKPKLEEIDDLPVIDLTSAIEWLATTADVAERESRYLLSTSTTLPVEPDVRQPTLHSTHLI
jgi:hypothetical protein